MAAYYNDNDPFAAAWLRELIKAGLIPAGDVDTRSIAEVQPDDLKGYIHVSFFAGIGGWPYALRRAGWPDDRPVWTGSCPCQPFSAAGKQLGEKDERHLWPEFYRLIKAWRPAAILGEQVASRLGREWLAGVRADLEDVAYDFGAADLCSASAGAPHIRQRLHWVAYARSEGRRTLQRSSGEDGRSQIEPDGYGDAVGLAYDNSRRQPQLTQCDGGTVGRIKPSRGDDAGGCGTADGLGDAGSSRAGRHTGTIPAAQAERDSQGIVDGAGGECAVVAGAADFWSTYDVVHCTDGKARRFESGSFPLAYGAAARVGRLRGYGNAINPELAAIFIKACEAARRG